MLTGIWLGGQFEEGTDIPTLPLLPKRKKRLSPKKSAES